MHFGHIHSPHTETYDMIKKILNSLRTILVPFWSIFFAEQNNTNVLLWVQLKPFFPNLVQTSVSHRQIGVDS